MRHLKPDWTQKMNDKTNKQLIIQTICAGHHRVNNQQHRRRFNPISLNLTMRFGSRSIYTSVTKQTVRPVCRHISVQVCFTAEMRLSLSLWSDGLSWETCRLRYGFQRRDATRSSQQIRRLKACAFTVSCPQNPCRKSNSAFSPLKSHYNLDPNKLPLPVKAACVCLLNKKLAGAESTNNELHYFKSLEERGASGSLPGASQQEAQTGGGGGYIRDELRTRNRMNRKPVAVVKPYDLNQCQHKIMRGSLTRSSPVRAVQEHHNKLWSTSHAQTQSSGSAQQHWSDQIRALRAASWSFTPSSLRRKPSCRCEHISASSENFYQALRSAHMTNIWGGSVARCHSSGHRSGHPPGWSGE